MRKKILVLWIWLDQWRVSKDYCRGNMRHCTMRYETYSPFRCIWIIVHYLFVESRFRARRVMVRWQPGSVRSMPWHKNIHPTIESSWFWNVIHVGPIWKSYIYWVHIISVWKTVLTFLRKWRSCIYMLPEEKSLTVWLREARGFLFATVSRPTWRIIQTLIQWMLRALAGGWIGRIVKMTTRIYLLLNWDWLEVYLHSPYVEIFYA